MPRRSKLTAEMWAKRKANSADRRKEAQKAWRAANPPPDASRITSIQLANQVRRIEPAPYMLLPLLPRPHPLAALVFTTIPPSHPARNTVRQGTVLIWQLSTYARDVHVSYKHWAHIESAQWLAYPYFFPTLLLARRFVAIRREQRCPDTPASEKGCTSKVYWSPESLAAILPTDLKPFGDAIRASPI